MYQACILLETFNIYVSNWILQQIKMYKFCDICMVETEIISLQSRHKYTNITTQHKQI